MTLAAGRQPLERPMRRAIFLHIPKTAGMTLRSVVQRQYRPSEVLIEAPVPRPLIDAWKSALDDGDLAGQWQALSEMNAARTEVATRTPAERLALCRILLGHFWFGVHDALPGQWTYVTVIREPVERALSLYGFRVARQGLRTSLEEYVDRGLDLDIRDGQTRRLASLLAGRADGFDCTAETLETAKRRLSEDFAAVGVTERFDDSLIHFGEALGWRNPRYIPTNVSRSRPPRSNVPLEIQQRLLDLNRADVELHGFASKLLAARIEERPGHDAEVDRLRRRNTRYRFIAPVERAATKVRRVPGAIARRVGGR